MSLWPKLRLAHREISMLLKYPSLCDHTTNITQITIQPLGENAHLQSVDDGKVHINKFTTLSRETDSI